LLDVLRYLSSYTDASAQQTHPPDQQTAPPSFKDIFLFTSWKNRTLFSVSQAGLVNNLNDGLAWGLFPLFFAVQGLSIAQIGLLAGIYPGVWGTTQLLTGVLADLFGVTWAIGVIGGLTFLSGVVVQGGHGGNLVTQTTETGINGVMGYDGRKDACSSSTQ
jgi:hypothetical protein